MTHRILAVAFPPAQSLDILGPLEVFTAANHLSGKALYQVELAGPEAGALATTAGVDLVAHLKLHPRLKVPDTLLVAGGQGARDAATREDWMASLGALAGAAPRVAAVCTGAFALAATGCLEGRRAVTHWQHCRALACQFPQVKVEEDALFIEDGKFFTSAGVTAGIDLALALLERDQSPELALRVARQLVVYLRRPGGQSQFSAHLVAPTAKSEFHELSQWILEHLAGDLSVEALAERMNMSPRHFARRFRAEMGMGPGEFVQRMRLDEARRCLLDSDQGLGQVAGRCGYPTLEALRLSFQRHLKVSPGEFRARFRTT
jgi:transcriptional regulator GlxA family with amidase domain